MSTLVWLTARLAGRAENSPLPRPGMNVVGVHKCDAGAVPGVDANVRTRSTRECAQPREVACTLPSPLAQQALDVRIGRKRFARWLDCRAIHFCQPAQPRRVDVALDDEQMSQYLVGPP